MSRLPRYRSAEIRIAVRDEQQLRREGIAIINISHRMNEVYKYRSCLGVERRNTSVRSIATKSIRGTDRPYGGGARTLDILGKKEMRRAKHSRYLVG